MVENIFTTEFEDAARGIGGVRRQRSAGEHAHTQQGQSLVTP